METQMSLETEVSVGGRKYLIGRLPAFDQMHLIADARNVLTGLALLKRDRPKEMSEKEFLNTAQVITMSVGTFPPETRERVWNLCLGQVKRQEKVGWQPVMASPGQMQFADMDPVTISRLLFAVFEHNKLLDFFFDGLSDSGQKTTGGDGQPSGEGKTG